MQADREKWRQRAAEARAKGEAALAKEAAVAAHPVSPLHPITAARAALAGAAAVEASLEPMRRQVVEQRAKDEAVAAKRVQALNAAARAQAEVLIAQQNRNVWTDQQFENWALGEARTVDGARRKLDAQLALQVDEIDRVCHLSDAQKQKVRLLGWGDAKRVLDEYEAAKRRFNDLGNDTNKLSEVSPLTQRLQGAMRAGPFQAGSLVAKSLGNTLTPEQTAKYDAVARERSAARLQAQLALAVATFEESVPLTDAQRTALLAALSKEVRPFRPTGQYDTYVLMNLIGKVPEEKLKPALTPGLWKAWTGYVAQYQGAIQNLRQRGMLPELDDDPTGAAKP